VSKHSARVAQGGYDLLDGLRMPEMKKGLELVQRVSRWTFTYQLKRPRTALEQEELRAAVDKWRVFKAALDELAAIGLNRFVHEMPPSVDLGHRITPC
jgi:hypothetical protein